MNYKSDRTYQIWAYTASHNFLLLRSPQLFKDVDDYSEEKSFNIDIEFFGISYLQLPDILCGLAIKEIVKNIPKKFRRYSNSPGLRVFQLKSQGNNFYIIGAGFKVGKNSWISEDRISNFHLEYDEIIASS